MRALLSLLFLCACGGLVITDTDAGDAGLDASADGGGDSFACGEPGHYVYCVRATQYCELVVTTHTRAYSCNPNPSSCQSYPQVSQPYTCSCYVNGDETFITVCQ